MFKVGADGIFVSRSVILNKLVMGQDILVAVIGIAGDNLVVKPAELHRIHIGARAYDRHNEWIIGGVWGVGHDVTYAIDLKEAYRILVISHYNWGGVYAGVALPNPEGRAAQTISEVRLKLMKALDVPPVG